MSPYHSPAVEQSQPQQVFSFGEDSYALPPVADHWTENSPLGGEQSESQYQCAQTTTDGIHPLGNSFDMAPMFSLASNESSCSSGQTSMHFEQNQYSLPFQNTQCFSYQVDDFVYSPENNVPTPAANTTRYALKI